MDRVVIDTDIITVIDYKSGSSNDNYDTQINRYKEILGQLYPEKKIEGIVLYIEEK
jgi:ATP-dependent exoDNAse (exonuclease V) beta subunit